MQRVRAPIVGSLPGMRQRGGDVKHLDGEIKNEREIFPRVSFSSDFSIFARPLRIPENSSSERMSLC